MDDNETSAKLFNYTKFRFTINIKGCKIYKIMVCTWDRYKFFEQGLLTIFKDLPYTAKFIRSCLNHIVVLALCIVFLAPLKELILPNSAYMITYGCQIHWYGLDR